MTRLPRTRKRQDAKPRGARYENEGKPVPCANCKEEFVRRRRDQMYCRRPECRKEIQRRAHMRWYSRRGVEQRAKRRRQYAADPTKEKRRQNAMYQRKKAAAEDEAGANFATNLAAVYMTVGSGRRGAAAGGGGTPGGQAARKAGRPRKPLAPSQKVTGRQDAPVRHHKGHAVPGMGGSRMRGLMPWRVSVAVPHTRGGLGGLACTAVGLRGHRPGTGRRRPGLRAEPPPLDQGCIPWAVGRGSEPADRYWCRRTRPSGFRSSVPPCFMNKSSISLK